MSIYALKPAFQNLLRPFVRQLHMWGITANQVTLLAAIVSVALGLWLAIARPPAAFLALIPAWMLLRMAMNAIDGMLAREFGQKSHLGAFLNELADVISDASLYLPFALLPHFQPVWVGTVIVLSVVVEMAGTVALLVGASRRYDGPFGKSDRAFAFGLLGLAVALGLPPMGWTLWIFPLMTLLSALTIVNRVRAALAETAGKA